MPDDRDCGWCQGRRTPHRSASGSPAQLHHARGGSYCVEDVDLVSRGGRGGQADQPPHRDDEGEPSGGYSTTLGNLSSPFSHIEFELLQHEG